jgi:hypothetical protein
MDIEVSKTLSAFLDSVVQAVGPADWSKSYRHKGKDEICSQHTLCLGLVSSPSSSYGKWNFSCDEVRWKWRRDAALDTLHQQSNTKNRRKFHQYHSSSES